MSAMANFWPKLPVPSIPRPDAATGTPDDTVSMQSPTPKTPKKPAEVPKNYVHLESIGVSETFDAKYKDTLPPIMNAGIAAAIDGSSKLTTTEAAEGFYLDGNLTLKRTDKGITAALTMQMADWPKKSMFAFPSGKVGVEVYNPKKIDDDVNAAVTALIEKILLTVVPEFEKRAK